MWNPFAGWLRRKSRWCFAVVGRSTICAVACLLLVTCQSRQNPEQQHQTIDTELGGTRWKLQGFISNNDQHAPQFAERNYFAYFSTDGMVSLELGCNWSGGTWKTRSGSSSGGSLSFDLLESTWEPCLPVALSESGAPSSSGLGEKFLRDSKYIRSYVIRGQRLYMNLQVDAGSYIWQLVIEAAS